MYFRIILRTFQVIVILQILFCKGSFSLNMNGGCNICYIALHIFDKPDLRLSIFPFAFEADSAFLQINIPKTR